jgi:small subunit ribosomal protein S17
MSRLITGRVSSDKSNKTIVIKVEMTKMHPIYRKRYIRDRKFMAHDEKNEAKIGDLVRIRESKPLSARKQFVLDEIIEKGQTGFVEEDTTADVPIEELEKKEVPSEPQTKAKAEPKKEENVREDTVEKEGIS